MDLSTQKAPRFLVVEDRPEDAELMIRELGRASFPFNWSLATTEAEFIAALESPPDLILSDYSMPGFGAVRALEILRTRGSDIPLLVITASLGDAAAAECMKLGADDYLLKDRLGRLREAVAQALEKKRLKDERQKADRALRESERLNKAIIDSAIDCIITIDQEGKIVDFNPAAEKTFGTSRSDAIGTLMADLIIPSRLREAHNRGLARLLATGESRILGQRLELTAQRAGGVEFPVELSITAIGSWDAPMFTGHLRDITERKSQEAKIARFNRIQSVLSSVNTAIVRATHGQQLFSEACRIAVEHGQFGMVWIGLYDPDTMDVTPAASAGYEADDGWASLKSTARPTATGQGSIGRAIRERKPVVVNDMTLAPADGGPRREKAIERGFRSVIALPFIVEEAVAGIFVLFAREANAFNDEEVRLLTEMTGEISRALEHMARRERLEVLSHHEPLTGLPNRASLVERLGRMLKEARSKKAPVTLLLAYMPRMQDVFDALGYDPANRILRSLAARLRANTEFGGNVARVSFDEFAVPLAGYDIDEAGASSRRLQRIFRTPVLLEGAEIEVQATVGMSVFPEHADDADLLIRRAGLAAREGARTNEPYFVYEGVTARENPLHLALIAGLRNAITVGQLELHYQPKVDLKSRRLLSFEALVRWRHPAKGLVSPAEFVPVAERTGLMRPLTVAVIEMALAQLSRWTASGHRFPVAVNLSAASLYDPEFVGGVVSSAERHGVPLELLELEITEAALVERPDAAAKTLKALGELGCRIYIDDFGTGYSSLAYLSKLPVNALKIDRSFILSMHTAPGDMSLVATIISLAHALNLSVVAEGVEMEEQAKLLMLLKCDEMQGYLFSKPLTAEDASALIERTSNASAPARVV
jgi:PAS domain S-box-containing protein/diguanylate cyclase (GGDEF)-like protein